MATKRPERIGSYRLIKPLGQGKFCELWEVERGSDLRRMAMKLIPPGAPQPKEAVAGLKHEFAVGQDLHHDNVVETIELVSRAECSYLILEVFHASNLKDWIRDQPGNIPPLADVILGQAATGLAYFHEQGWIHRDVKPDNFLADADGRTKLIDFNIARRKPGKLTRLLPGKTKVQGTLTYMSPEQIRGEATDERSDVYSFGCTMYELIGGKPPFTGTTTNELLGKHLRSRPPSLTVSAPSVSREFAELVDRTLAKEAAQRPASMADLVEQLAGTPVYRQANKSNLKTEDR